jgi:hypothetical protein
MVCPACNLSNPPSGRFCSNCGTALPTTPPQLLPPPPPQYLMQHPPRAKGSFLSALGIVVVAFVCLSLFGALLMSSRPEKESHREASSTSTPPESSHAPNVLYWQESEDTAAMDGARSIILARDATDSYQAWLETITPTLLVQCYSRRRPDVLVNIGAAASVEYGTDLHTVRLRFDSSSPVRQHWSKSKDDKALFSTSPTLLLADLKKHKVMLFEFDPFNTSTTATVMFDLSGLPESMAKHPECKTN